MKDYLTLEKIKDLSTHVGTIMTSLQSSLIEPEKLGLDTLKTDRFRVEGFFLIFMNGKLGHVSHSGHQKRQRGFMEVMTRLNNPRTEQNRETSDIIYSAAALGSSVQVYHMSYAQARMFFGIEEYSSLNNGHSILDKFRSNFKIPGRSIR